MSWFARHCAKQRRNNAKEAVLDQVETSQIQQQLTWNMSMKSAAPISMLVLNRILLNRMATAPRRQDSMLMLLESFLSIEMAFCWLQVGTRPLHRSRRQEQQQKSPTRTCAHATGRGTTPASHVILSTRCKRLRRRLLHQCCQPMCAACHPASI